MNQIIPTRKTVVDMVNDLVKGSFGYFYRGDYGKEFDDILFGGIKLVPSNRPCFIARPIIFGEGYQIPGILGKERGWMSDGSIIAVTKEYEKQAHKYSQLYEKATGKNSRVVLLETPKIIWNYVHKEVEKLTFENIPF